MSASNARSSRPAMIAGGVLLAAQIIHVGYVHVAPPLGDGGRLEAVLGGCSAQPVGCRRYFAWAPNDYLVEYRIHALLDGRPLDRGEIRDRYRIAATGTLEAPVQHLIDAIAAYERHYASTPARVKVIYRVNDGGFLVWSSVGE